MKTLLVAGCSSDVGKTTLGCRILETLPDWGALKISPVRPHACSGSPDCPACHGLRGPYALTVDAEAVGTRDTSLWARAGAARVGWLRAREESLGTAIPEALGAFAGLPGLLVEGNSFARHVRPDRIVLVARAGLHEVKESARQLLGVADWIVLNRGEGADPEPPPILARGAYGIVEVDAASGTAASTAALLAAIRAWARP